MGFSIPVRWHIYVKTRRCLQTYTKQIHREVTGMTCWWINMACVKRYVFILEFMAYLYCLMYSTIVNTLRPRQDGRHFADDIFTCIFDNENCCFYIKFSLKYVRKGPIDNNPALVQIMAWRRSGDKSLSEPMMISLPTHICVTRPQWVKTTMLLQMSWWWLTHWGRDNKATILQTTILVAFCEMKKF